MIALKIQILFTSIADAQYTCEGLILVRVTRAFFSIDCDTVGELMALDEPDELLTVVLDLGAGGDMALFLAATAASYNRTKHQKINSF